MFFFFNDTATTEIYTLSLHDALPILRRIPHREILHAVITGDLRRDRGERNNRLRFIRSEEHTSELQSPDHLVCRLLLEKKKRSKQNSTISKNMNQPAPKAHARARYAT